MTGWWLPIAEKHGLFGFAGPTRSQTSCRVFQCSLIGLLGRNWNKPTTWSGTGWADGLVSFTPNYAQD
jgi:hypothetical protein